MREIHPDPAVPESLIARLVELAATAYAERPDELHRLDAQRLLTPDWLQQPRMFGYACYTERFAGDLEGVAKRLDHLEELGVTYLHLMPLLKPREGDNDGGYAVQDYRTVRSDLGTMDDLRELATHPARARHQPVHGPRAQPRRPGARVGAGARGPATEQRYRDYFHVFTDEAVLDAFEQTLPEVFPDFAPGNFTWDDDLDAWVWTTFNELQWDLNWANPSVLLEFAEIILGLANLGVEVLRLDAIAFLWKRLGTTCQNQPEVHAITQALRAVTRIVAPAVAFKAEAIVGPRDLVQYLGTGAPRRQGQRPRLPQQPDGAGLVDARRPQHRPGPRRRSRPCRRAPSTATWITYVRCHDDIGWAIDDGDAHAVGVTGAGAPALPLRLVRRRVPGSVGRRAVFQDNPATGDRRISGTAASLTGPVGRPRRPGRDNALARLLLAHAIVAGWGGIPVIWSGDELARPTTPTGRASRPRGRQPLGAPTAARLVACRRSATTCARSPEGSSPVAHLAAVRARLPQLHAPPTPRCSTTPTTACSRWCVGTPAARSSVSTTSPSSGGPSTCTGFRRRADHAVRRAPRPRPRSTPTACSGCRRTRRGGSSRLPVTSPKALGPRASSIHVIRFENVTKTYDRQRRPALHAVDVDIEKGEFVFLVGQSGSGKSTFLRLVLREARPSVGKVFVAGKEVNRLASWKVPGLRRQIGTVFQDFRLLPNKTVGENVAFALQVIGKPRSVIRGSCRRRWNWSVSTARATGCPTSCPAGSSSG